MRTLFIILGGFALLGALAFAGRFLGAGISRSALAAAKLFIPLWLIIALANMWMGVSQAGYSVMEELPIFLLIFGLPALVAAVLWRKLA